MSGGHIPPPPPPPVDPATTVPPSHEVVIDVHQRQTTSPVVVDLEGGQAAVYVEGAGEGRNVSLASERAIRESEQTEDPTD